MLATTAATATGAIGPALYAGGSRRADRHMDIAIQVLSGGRRANWRVDVFGPCTEHLRLGRTVGTDLGNAPQDPRLRLAGDRFVLNWHAYASLHPLWYSYHHSYRCDSRLLRWSARRTRGSFR